MAKPILGLTPRQFWLHDRVRDCIEALQRQDLEEDYDNYRIKAKELAEELLYAVTEWERYYEKTNNQQNKV